MKPKKTKKANLEKNKVIFFQIGMIASLAIALLAFEWSSGEFNRKIITDVNNGRGETELSPPRTKQPLPPEVKPPDAFILVIKDNNEDVLNRIFKPTEIEPWEEFDFKKFPEITEKPDDDIPIRNCQEMPSFRHGDINEFIKYIQSIVIYPEEALKMEIKGKVVADFVVNKEGYVENVKIIKGVDPLLDNEVIRALKASPRWKPGKQRSIPVKVAFAIPIVFKIN